MLIDGVERLRISSIFFYSATVQHHVPVVHLELVRRHLSRHVVGNHTILALDSSLGKRRLAAAPHRRQRRRHSDEALHDLRLMRSCALYQFFNGFRFVEEWFVEIKKIDEKRRIHLAYNRTRNSRSEARTYRHGTLLRDETRVPRPALHLSRQVQADLLHRRYVFTNGTYRRALWQTRQQPPPRTHQVERYDSIRSCRWANQ